MWKEERKGMIFFLILFFHCEVARDRGSRVFFLICQRGMGGGGGLFFFYIFF